jgi:hypothetical protein
VFTLETLANARGHGIATIKDGDYRQPLDKDIVTSLKYKSK